MKLVCGLKMNVRPRSHDCYSFYAEAGSATRAFRTPCVPLNYGTTLCVLHQVYLDICQDFARQVADSLVKDLRPNDFKKRIYPIHQASQYPI